MTQDAVQVVWFKRDLRVRDHAPLVEAARRGPVLALYVYEPSWMTAPDFDPSHLEFIGASLAKLREGLRKRGGELVIRLGEMPDVLEELRRMVGFRALWSHEETGNAISYARDLRVKAWAQASGVVWHELPQNGVVRGLRDRDGWSQQWTRRMEAPILPAPERLTPVVGVDPQGVRGPEDVGLGPSERTDAMVGGELEAWRTLETFLWERGVNYRADMSSPVEGWWGCSRLSPYLAWGNLSMRHVFQRLACPFHHLKLALTSLG
ncbi:MAG: deoxyribodipyrimidine photo-lyase, partial [Myxococcota bacterium]